MERPTSITPLEFERTLELMGLTAHSRLGPNRVFLNGGPMDPIVFRLDDWDMHPADVEELLRSHSLDVDTFWDRHRFLYTEGNDA